MDTVNMPNRPIKASMTAFEIIEALEALDGAGVVELADELGMSQSTVHDHLSTLLALEYVVKREGKYHLSLKFLQHGIYVRNGLDVFNIGELEVDLLAQKTGEVAWLATEEHGKGVLIHKAAGENAMEAVGRLGLRQYLHATAAGKAMLAWMSDEKVDAIVDRHGLPAQTSDTITTRDELFDELESIHERGYSINDQENTEGIRAIGAPIVLDEDLLGAVSISGPYRRFSPEETIDSLSDELLQTTNQIEHRLRYNRGR